MPNDGNDVNITLGIDASGIDSSLQDIQDKISQIPQSLQDINNNNTITIETDTSQIDETTQKITDIKDQCSQGIPFVITAGDAIEALDGIATKINEITEQYAQFRASTAVAAVTSGANQADLKSIAIQDITPEASLNQVSTLEEQLSRIGAHKSEIEDLIPKYENLAIALGTDVNRAFSSTDQVMAQFGIDLQDQPKYFDTIVEGAQHMRGGFDDFSLSMPRVSDTVMKMGGDINDAIGVMDALSQAGVPTRKILTDLTTAMSEVNKEDKATGTDPTMAQFLQALSEKTHLSVDDLDI
jgi:phage-related minor tail protein